MDLGIEIDIVTKRRSNSSQSLGQSYPVMDDPGFVPDVSLPRPVATPMVSSETKMPLVEAAASSAAPMTSGEDGSIPRQANADVAGGLRAAHDASAAEASVAVPVESTGPPTTRKLHQTTLESLAACQWRPYANQPALGKPKVECEPRQATLDVTLTSKVAENEPVSMGEPTTGASGATAGNCPEALKRRSYIFNVF